MLLLRNMHDLVIASFCIFFDLKLDVVHVQGATVFCLLFDDGHVRRTIRSVVKLVDPLMLLLLVALLAAGAIPGGGRLVRLRAVSALFGLLLSDNGRVLLLLAG